MASDASNSDMPGSGDPTTLHVRRAMDGDLESISWIVARFTPLLISQARYRLGARLRRICDPDDLVADVWAVVLPRLAGLSSRDGRFTPVLLRFLATTLLYRFNNLVQKHITGKPLQDAGEDGEERDLLKALPDEASGVVTRVVRSESQGEVLQALEDLDDKDREVVILRGIEQNPNQEVATLLGELPNTVAVRYKRALERLRQRLPGSLFSELDG